MILRVKILKRYSNCSFDFIFNQTFFKCSSWQSSQRLLVETLKFHNSFFLKLKVPLTNRYSYHLDSFQPNFFYTWSVWRSSQKLLTEILKLPILFFFKKIEI